MDTPDPTTGPPSHTSVDEQLRFAQLTGMTPDAARTFLDFHTGMRWLRRDPE